MDSMTGTLCLKPIYNLPLSASPCPINLIGRSLPFYDMKLKRRELLKFGSIGGASALAGCSNYFSNPTSNLHIVNHHSEPHNVQVIIRDLNSDTPVIHQESYDLGPAQSDDQEVTESDLMNEGQYNILAYLIDNESVRGNTTYSPHCSENCVGTLHIQIRNDSHGTNDELFISFLKL